MAKQQKDVSQTTPAAATEETTPFGPGMGLQELWGNGAIVELLKGLTGGDSEYSEEVPEGASTGPLGPRRELPPEPVSPGARDPRLDIRWLDDLPFIEEKINDYLFDPKGLQSPTPPGIPSTPFNDPNNCQTTTNPQACQDATTPKVAPAPPIRF